MSVLKILRPIIFAIIYCQSTEIDSFLRNQDQIFYEPDELYELNHFNSYQLHGKKLSQSNGKIPMNSIKVNDPSGSNINIGITDSNEGILNSDESNYLEAKESKEPYGKIPKKVLQSALDTALRSCGQKISKKAAKICRSACQDAVECACSSEKCYSGLRKELKKLCKKECKNAFN